jgi:hypothetical protein
VLDTTINLGVVRGFKVPLAGNLVMMACH